ncbi:hypothetical protein VM1G_11147 [Cytospora mali]|uniref:Holocytochrome c-type synthase n=1 Tax=Cytospora mali TaxID=578113 RepID=A0A194VJL5_CYTMA|nr:hypothetical protein VM1G_11147 [Valsa mali]
MSQQDLLDTLFLNTKALGDVEGSATTGGSQSPKNTTNRDTNERRNATDANTTVFTMNKDTQGSAASSSTAAECPVDHKSREACPFSSSNTTSNTDNANPSSAEEKCPVDHNSREAWLAQARAAQEAQTQAQQPPAATKYTPTSTSEPKTSSGWGWPKIPFLSSSSPPTKPSDTTSTATTLPQPQPTKPLHGLTTEREVSSIPRAKDAGPPPYAGPSNHETETGADPKSGNWVYPSEKMFFEAMKRKGHDTRVADMKTVVPIHNAVNERAWKEIREWEKPYEAPTCPQGPMLFSFAGLSTKMSPRARLNTLLGYTAPFDRHDWIVDRCGTKVEYVIDFYAGRPGAAGGKPSFYLDVRPKLNSWEGVKMRALKGLGLA